MKDEKHETKKTFKERYEEAKAEKQTPTPAQVFIQRCMDACKVSENTVRGWLCNSRRPDALAQEALAREFGCTAEELFPAATDTTEDGYSKTDDHHPYPNE